MTGAVDNAFNHLQIIANKNYDNYNHIINDTDLNPLHNDKRWKDLLKVVKLNQESEAK